MKFAVSVNDRTYSLRARWWLLAAALLTALFWQPVTAWAADRFDDVPDSNIFHDDIAWMSNNGVTAGCGGDSFCPKAFVTREQMAAFIRRLDSKNVFTTFQEAEEIAASGSSGSVDADTLGGKDSSEFAGRLFAVVRQGGGLLRGNGVTETSRVNTGFYHITFERDVSGCAYAATLQNDAAGAGGPWGTISAALSLVDDSTVRIFIASEGGGYVDAPFHLIVMC